MNHLFTFCFGNCISSSCIRLLPNVVALADASGRPVSSCPPLIVSSCRGLLTTTRCTSTVQSDRLRLRLLRPSSAQQMLWPSPNKTPASRSVAFEPFDSAVSVVASCVLACCVVRYWHRLEGGRCVLIVDVIKVCEEAWLVEEICWYKPNHGTTQLR